MDYKIAFLLALTLSWAQSLSVQTSIQGGNFDEKTPLEEGNGHLLIYQRHFFKSVEHSLKNIYLCLFAEDDVLLVCQADEEYSTCMWSHEITDQYVS